MANHECLRYFTPKDPSGWPTCGQMQGFTNNVALPCLNKGCDFIELPAKQMTIPTGNKRCFHPLGLRYFYRVLRTTPVTIQPNSLVCAYDFPKTPNDCQWLEWYKICM